MTVGRYQATVIGAGPAGLAIVGKLLDSSKISSILWIDPLFQAGRLSNYTSAPSNTKVKYFLSYANGPLSFQNYLRKVNGNPDVSLNPIARLAEMDPEQTCLLKYASDLVFHLTKIMIKEHSHINTVQSFVSRLSWQTNVWNIMTVDGSSYLSDKVFLATGSHPRQWGDPPIQETQELYSTFPSQASPISLDDSLDLERLNQCICKEDHVAIIGNSHSAQLALMNLDRLGEEKRPASIIQLYRHDLRYAEYMDEGWILYDNTGLKGLVAEYTKQFVDPKYTQGGVCLVKGLTQIPFLKGAEQKKQVGQALSNVTKFIPAIGFVPNRFSDLFINGISIDPSCQITGNGQDGGILVRQGRDSFERREAVESIQTIPNIYGYGIAFPEKVTDPYGNVEESVGLFKFMKYIQRTMPQHLESINVT